MLSVLKTVDNLRKSDVFKISARNPFERGVLIFLKFGKIGFSVQIKTILCWLI